jgi:hypothetical protein
VSLKSLLLLITFATALEAFFFPGDPSLDSATTNTPASAELFLKFQNVDNDYLLFYDAEGSILFLRYRQDKWDYANDRLRDSLQQGVTYRIQAKDLKRLPEGELPTGASGAGLPRPAVIRKIRKIRDSFVGQLGTISESALRDLRY